MPRRKKKFEWNKVTWYSKLFAMLVFAYVFLLGFYFGGEIQKVIAIGDTLTLQTVYVDNLSLIQDSRR